MRKLVGAGAKMLYRDKQTIFWAMAFPVIFAVVFGLFDLDRGPDVKVGVVSQAASPVAQGFEEGLGRVDSFDVSHPSTEWSARDLLEDGELDVVVSLQEAEQGGSVGVLYNGANVETNQLALGMIERIAGQMNLAMSGVTSPPLQVNTRAVEARDIGYYDFLLPGLVAMGVMNFSIIGMAVAIARFREQRILKRILATPLSPARFMTSQVVTRLLLALVQTVVILAVGIYGFGANLYGNVAWIFVFAVVANLIFLNFGIAVAGRAANPDAAQGTANAIALPMMFMAGVFFPIETLPQILQAVVAWLPLTPLIEAMRSVALEGASLADTGAQLALLSGWVAISFILARRTFRFAN